ncbi:hypothetical protein [Actibacterium pelagium]|uniref:Lipoprotein n=1 Tax=Actibacterium pelagium TaxID=2029103 RepID=A0A917EIP6_9RHOB|nr:hypothetical protein [Actibacterium pelagium]GGE45832.1 hypothetical protein GCM10011517_11870 [Actibacterium pelagium]
MMRLSFICAVSLASFGVLAGCATPEPKVPISAKAAAAMPEGVEITDLRRLSNGCYFIVQQIGPRTISRPLEGPDGLQVCDEVPLEQMLSPSRVVVNERAI